MRIGITGASGMLGTALIDRLHLEHELFATSRTQGILREHVHWECFDLLDTTALINWMSKNKIQVVIHCAAMVNVDKCEELADMARKLHYQTTKVISEYIEKTGGYVIYLSTDSVFNGNKSGMYSEYDMPDPLNVYAKTKLAGEGPVLEMQNGLVLRTNIVGWSRDSRLSFVEWVLKELVEKNKVPLFYDVTFTPLHVSDLSDVIHRLISNKVTGLYHIGSNAPLSKYEFGMAMADIFNLDSACIAKASMKTLRLKADRPSNMSLSSVKLKNVLNINLPTSTQAIQRLKEQYDNGWLSSIKGFDVQPDYQFWK